MSEVFQYEETLAVGIVQTTIDAAQAWSVDAAQPKMSRIQDDHAWLEIRRAMRTFQDGELRPRMLVFPELSLPRTRLDDFEHLIGTLNAIALVGVDYRLNRPAKIARNQGMVFVPRGFFRDYPSLYCSRIIFGKTYPSPRERDKLRQLHPPWSFQGDQNVYVIDCQQYGRVGVSICYDFMDIERSLMYRGHIHHLFVLAYNRDLGMFRSLADSLSRTIFCNVVVCNTGLYGGSLAVSPYREAYKRTLYSHNGGGLFTTQVVKLPMQGIVRALRGMVNSEFKDPPPGVL